MRHRVKKRLSLLILLVVLPLYVIVSSSVMMRLDLPKWAEILAYIVLGIIWVVPLKHVFLGVGQAPPEGEE